MTGVFGMRKLTVTMLLCALLAAVAWAQPAQDELFSQIETIVAELGEISGLKPLRKIEYDLIDKVQVKQFLEGRIKEVLKPEEIRAEEITLKKFGFVPADFDLKKATIELLTEQAAAFYDFNRKKLFILDSAPSSLQQVALVHELAHALADQHFNLEKYIERAMQSDDGQTARMAVMEGQATWLMSEMLARRTGQSLKTSPAILQMMVRSAELSAGQFPIFDAAPLYMRESLLFPYSQGMLFQHAVFEKLGKKAFAELFRSPPVSSQQIIHPEKYFGGVKPSDPSLPKLAAEREYRELAEGTIGELDFSILLRQYVGKQEAEKASPLWKGGRYRVLEHKKTNRTVLLHVSEWESPEAARQFFKSYQRVLKGKWKSIRIDTTAGDHVAGRGDDGHFVLRLDRAVVSSVEGLASPDEIRGAMR